MKINSSYGFEKYQNISKARKNDDSFSSKLGVGKNAASSSASNVDKIAFSGDGAAKAELARLNAAISKDVDSVGNAQRIAQLKEQVENGTYYVASDVLADKILDKLG